MHFFNLMKLFLLFFWTKFESTKGVTLNLKQSQKFNWHFSYDKHWIFFNLQFFKIDIKIFFIFKFNYFLICVEKFIFIKMALYLAKSKNLINFFFFKMFSLNFIYFIYLLNLFSLANCKGTNTHLRRARKLK